MVKEKGSKFIAVAYPVESDEEIREHLQQLRKQYYDARHHCYAWMLGPEKKMFRANDDGEPNHSAGDPILGQIRSRDLTNILVVVVRYFGGVKLGVGGLIAAYKFATDDALQNAIIIERQVELNIKLNFAYEFTPEVMRMIKDFELKIIEQNFTNSCEMTLVVTLLNKKALEEKVRLMNSTGVPVRLTIN